MLRRIVLPCALVLSAFAPSPAVAQALGHLAVPARQMVSVTFFKGPTDGPGQMTQFSLVRGDNSTLANNHVPAGQALVITDLSWNCSYPGQASPFQFSVGLERMDANLFGSYATWRETVQIPAFTSGQNGRMSLGAGMVFAGSARPRISTHASTVPVASWSNATVYGFGYLVAY